VGQVHRRSGKPNGMRSFTRVRWTIVDRDFYDTNTPNGGRSLTIHDTQMLDFGVNGDEVSDLSITNE